MKGCVTYSYVPADWSQEKFLKAGGYVVVFLNYNKGGLIRKSVASALGQDYPSLEMFFMDDASTDGSGDVMESLVREYRGRHKVTVVRNTENQHICGQWNIVSKLATGNWYGMFCADDVAYHDRVTIVSSLIQKYPTLLGLCTNCNAIVPDGTIDCPNSPMTDVVETGRSDLYAILRYHLPIIGATAFWHKSLFDGPLPFAPLDDVLLRCIVSIKGHDSDDPVWLWAGNHKTVLYSVGTGITTEKDILQKDLPFEDLWVARWPATQLRASLWARSMDAVLQWGNSVLLRKELAAIRVRKYESLMLAADRSPHLLECMACVCSFDTNLRQKSQAIYSLLLYLNRRLFGLKATARLIKAIHGGKS